MNDKPSPAAHIHAALAPSDSEAMVTMRMLEALESRSSVTQRMLASELGIAVGLVNAYMKRCLRKGYLKATKVPASRYAYYLTPKGFAEKSRLAASFFVSGFQFFRTARSQCAGLFAECVERGIRRVVLCGTGEMCEVAIISATEFDVELAAVYDPAFDGKAYCGLAVVRGLAAAGRVDAAIVTDMRLPQQTYDAMLELMPAERVLVPPMLRIGNPNPKGRRR